MVCGTLFVFASNTYAQVSTPTDTTKPDLRYPFEDHGEYLYYSPYQPSPMYLSDPSNIESKVEYDPETNQYILSKKIGEMNYRPSTNMTMDEYWEYDNQNTKQDYWQQRSKEKDFETRASFIPSLKFGGEAFDRIFGNNTINITPQGSAELIFGFNINRQDNPTLPEKLRRTPSFTFDEKIQMNVTGTIGDKLELSINYNTEATFDFENKTKLAYTGDEDDIIKKIEAGNVSLPLPGSLITGSQSLFGLKTELQFGRLTVTTVLSQQRGESSVINIQDGAQVNEFEVTVDDYDENRHFFLSHYFKEHYNGALEILPTIKSDVKITKIEVWVTNKTNKTESIRNIVAFMDLAEIGDNISNTQVEPNYNFLNTHNSNRYPDNNNNNLFSDTANLLAVLSDFNTISNSINIRGIILDEGTDFEKIESARKLTAREYTLNPLLGYISLNTALNADEILAVAYEVTTIDSVYRVGQFSTEDPNGDRTLILKLIKGTNLSTRFKNWELMMKNVYSLGAYQVEREDFYLDVLYQNDETGLPINYLPELQDEILIRMLGLDKCNFQNDQQPDGVFDFISGITIMPGNGRVFFPVLEPFGEDLRIAIENAQREAEQETGQVIDINIDDYIFDELYDSTKTQAQQVAEKNKFYLSGTYKSAGGSEIPLNAMNIPQGSVVVTAGGIKLQEGLDYTVDYTLGRVKIINPVWLESGTPLRISLESNALFNFQTKTMVGSHFDYRISDDFNLGATVLNLTERPLTQKVNYGDEPISNTIWGFNGSYRTESQFLTTLVDKIPLIETKEKSTITVEGEFAHLIPGSSKAIGKNGVAYIDDFEGSETSIEMKTFHTWALSSTPQGQTDMFPEAELVNDIQYGYNRAKLAWYVIDPIFLRNNTSTPDHIKSDKNSQSSHYVREVFEEEIFPLKENYNNIPTNIQVLNVAYYPRERGPYNFDVEATSPYSAGIDENGYLNDPASRWGGIMKEITNPDFEANNIEFIEFWLMDPYVEDSASGVTGGDLYFNIGDISEDILRDSRKSFENGLPVAGQDVELDTTVWGVVPDRFSVTPGFSTDEEARALQDVGLDGLNNAGEIDLFDEYLSKVDSVVNETKLSEIIKDPSNDDYHYFRGTDYDGKRLGILERYKKYNNTERNSPTDKQSPESYITSATTLPDKEDLNDDNTLCTNERYYQYRVSLRKSDFVVGQNYIVDSVRAKNIEFANGQKSSVDWYQFKIPLSDYERAVGAIDDFKSIRFMRMFLTNFADSVILRFARLELVRSEWRKYQYSMREVGEGTDVPEPMGSLEISAINIEENPDYVLPPGIDRVIDPTQPQLRQLNEQSMVLKVENIADGDARAAYKNANLDMRQYKRLKMEIHAEALPVSSLKDGELKLFIRLGSDYKNNYYEYELPLYISPSGDKDPSIVWPDENSINIPLSIFTDLKLERNDLSRQAGSSVSASSPWSKMEDNGRRVSIRGFPSLDDVRTIMIGIRNPSSSTNTSDGGGPKSGEIWVNELRLTDFNDKGGWAANARMTAKLADFGSVSLAGYTSTPGWGSIDQKVNERSMEYVRQLDVSSNLELGKFFPEKAGVRIPMYTGYSKTVIDPQYDPRSPDIEFKESMKHTPKAERDSIKKMSQDFTERKSINFTNVGIGKTSGKPKIYSISNWSLSYYYSNTYSRNIDIKDYNQNKYRGVIGYNYTLRPKNVMPLRKVKGLNNPYFRIIKDFNFYYFPSRISIRTDVDRRYDEKLLRPRIASLKMTPTVRKDFLWNRYYDVNYDLTRALKLSFSASTFSRIDEPPYGKNDYRVVKHDEDFYEHWKDSVVNCFLHGGRVTHYNHQITASYMVPINKLPILNWTSLSTKYTGNYSWDAAPLRTDDIELGNTIKNSYTASANGQLNMLNLYNKVGMLQRINQKYSGRGKRKGDKEYKEVTYKKDGVRFIGGVGKTIIHNLKTKDVQVKVTNEEGAEVNIEVRVLDQNRIRITTEEDIRNVSVAIIGSVEKKPNPIIFIAENITRIAMGVRNISISYQQSQGAILPGYLPKTYMLGYNEDWSAPSTRFILGLPDDELLQKAQDNDWLTKSKTSLQNTAYIQTYTRSLNLRSTVEPIADLRIDLSSQWMKTENMYQNFVYDLETDAFEITNYQETGNYSISFIAISTAFDKPDKTSNKSQTFTTFKEEYRYTISERHARQYGITNIVDSTGFYEGFSGTSQQVLIPAFMAAYSGIDANKVTLEEFPSMLHMMPNWSAKYSGFTRIEFINKYFRTFELSHIYRCTYSINSYISNNNANLPNVYTGDIIPKFDIQAISINEQFTPLLGINMNWQNNLTTRLEFRKSRNISLSLSNAMVTEMRTNEYIIGIGYRFEEVQIIIHNRRTGQKEYESDVNIRGDLSMRDNITIIRSVTDEINEPQSGQRIYSITANADYALSDSFSLTFFMQKDITKPHVSPAFPTQNFKIGFSVRFTLIK